jgi:hypothetical protein
MGNKNLSLNLVLKKKGSSNAFQTVLGVSDLERQAGASPVVEPRPVLSLTLPDSPAAPETCMPPDTSEEVPSRTLYQEMADATPPSGALAVFPDWQGLLVKSSVLGLSVWVVRSHLDGIALAKETGHAALLLDDVLAQKGRSREEARTALLPILITGRVH